MSATREVAASSSIAAATKAHAFDALALDGELEKLLHDRWDAVCATLGGRFAALAQPELQAALRGLLWYLSAFVGSRSPGQALLNLHCAAGDAAPEALQRVGPALDRPTSGRAAPDASSVPRSRRLLHGALVVLLPWVWARLARLTNDPDHPERRRWTRWMNRAEGLVACASLLVALRFLRDGRYPSLPMALLGIRLVYTVPEYRPAPVFQFMEQQLIWRTVADTAVAVRSLLHSGPRALPPPPSMREDTEEAGAQEAARPDPVPYFGGLRRWVRSVAGVDSAAAQSGGGGVPLVDVAGCVLCGADPPHTRRPAACGHEACYFCLASARLADADARCPRCARTM